MALLACKEVLLLLQTRFLGTLLRFFLELTSLDAKTIFDVLLLALKPWDSVSSPLESAHPIINYIFPVINDAICDLFASVPLASDVTTGDLRIEKPWEKEFSKSLNCPNGTESARLLFEGEPGNFPRIMRPLPSPMRGGRGTQLRSLVIRTRKI